MDMLPIFRQQRDILRASTPDQFIDKNLPVLYEGIMHQWASYPKWNIQYLADTFGNYKISADRNINGQISYIQAPMKDYAGYIRDTADPIPYYGKSTMHLKTHMNLEYQTPDAFNCWYKAYYTAQSATRKIDLSSLYFGPRGARSTIHQDIWGTSFWNALYEGRKLWLFFPQEQEHLLYNGEFDPLTADIASYPLLGEAEPIICIQEPGELIYCPANIWHWAYVLEPGLALSENFINEDNYLHVLQYFQRMGYTNAEQKMKDIANTFLNKQ
ncbi:cupin-like domain-containing protein [Chitinophaga rhizophila]|uniref:Cupin-like domain-containing protein n=1 Tax=Chitinophaga rhizophila TaxID=2866212 RepID=A0ABS7GF34_9BACT|nr:cupin-like domain-containing protein [Chitinophaga rhizophila]MBW8686001.1 cupin-like domain-containing protein [Chitinophaga rhizophila]